MADPPPPSYDAAIAGDFSCPPPQVSSPPPQPSPPPSFHQPSSSPSFPQPSESINEGDTTFHSSIFHRQQEAIAEANSRLNYLQTTQRRTLDDNVAVDRMYTRIDLDRRATSPDSPETDKDCKRLAAAFLAITLVVSFAAIMTYLGFSSVKSEKHHKKSTWRSPNYHSDSSNNYDKEFSEWKNTFDRPTVKSGSWTPPTNVPKMLTNLLDTVNVMKGLDESSNDDCVKPPRGVRKSHLADSPDCRRNPYIPLLGYQNGTKCYVECDSDLVLSSSKAVLDLEGDEQYLYEKRIEFTCIKTRWISSIKNPFYLKCLTITQLIKHNNKDHIKGSVVISSQNLHS